MKNKVQIHIGGDLVINKPIDIDSETCLFNKGPINNLILNLECPMTDSNERLLKTGPNLKSSPAFAKEINKMGCHILNLCNNHIMDFGAQGLNDTIQALKGQDIEFFGVGNTISDANKFFIKDIDGVKVALYGVCEHEWSVATKEDAGANPIDVINFIELKKQEHNYDYLIVFIHGGKEYYPYPTPGIQKLSRFYASNGAHAVICQHTHIAGCYEEYKNVPIFYGQGNFIFPSPSQDNFDWNAGFLIQLNFGDGLTWSLIPYKQDQSKGSVYYMDEDEENTFLSSIHERSKEILDENIVIEKWEAKSREQGPVFIRQMTGINKRVFSWIHKLKLDGVLFQKDAFRSRQAMIKCETHRELIETYLKIKNS